MTYSAKQTRTWDQKTPNNGDYLEKEFNQIYENFALLDGSWKLCYKAADYDERLTTYTLTGENNLGLYRVVLRKFSANSDETVRDPDGTIYNYKYTTVHCGLYSNSEKHSEEVSLPYDSNSYLKCSNNKFTVLHNCPNSWHIYLVYKLDFLQI